MIEQDKIHTDENGDQVILPREEYNRLIIENNENYAKIEYLKYELDKIKKLMFGSKSERFIPVDDAQLSLDLGQQKSVVTVTTEEISYTRTKDDQKKGHGRPPLPAELYREEIILEPTVDVSGAVKIGEVITEVLDYIPGKVFVKKYIRPKYAMKDDQETVIVIANLPSLPIPRGNVSAGLLAYILVSKFVDHLPFYRQKQILKRLGIDIAESTINDWFRNGCDLLEPLYECMKQMVLNGNYLQADETPIPVLTDDKPGSTHKGYYWVYYDPIQNLIFFDYQKGRGREGPEGILKEFKGALQADGYGAYVEFGNDPDIILLACMAHARRKFDEAKKNDKTRAEYALTLIQKLYAVEEEARTLQLSHKQRKELRLEKSKPLMNEFKQWLTENIYSTLPQSAIGKAIQYTLSLWPRLERYLEEGHYEIDNNLIENSIRPVALGRKNYMFAGSHEAAQRAAMMYSFFGNCKKNGIDPLEWLTKVFTRIPEHSNQRLIELLPQKLQ